VKFLLPEALRVPDVLARFQREARAAAKIQSEYVARVMDVGALESGEPYLVMEYLDGRDLSQELRARGPLPVEEAIDYLLQAAAGVAEAHAMRIVHRDLKPSNLFLAQLSTGRKLVKVLDFGIAKHATEGAQTNLTHSFSVLGSIAYMSPEQVRSSKNVDARSDVWALGVVLFELLTGKLPFEGDSVPAFAVAITSDVAKTPRSFRPDIPEAVERIILDALQKRPDQRVPSLAVLASGLAPFGGRRAAALAGKIADSLGVTGSIALGASDGGQRGPMASVSDASLSKPAVPAVTADSSNAAVTLPNDALRSLAVTGQPWTRTTWRRAGPPGWRHVAIAAVGAGTVLSTVIYFATRGSSDADRNATSSSASTQAASAPSESVLTPTAASKPTVPAIAPTELPKDETPEEPKPRARTGATTAAKKAAPIPATTTKPAAAAPKTRSDGPIISNPFGR
jgi:serine/threonine-protein kinase